MKPFTIIVFTLALALITAAAFVIGDSLSPTFRFIVYYTAGSFATLVGLLIIEFTT